MGGTEGVPKGTKMVSRATKGVPRGTERDPRYQEVPTGTKRSDRDINCYIASWWFLVVLGGSLWFFVVLCGSW